MRDRLAGDGINDGAAEGAGAGGWGGLGLRWEREEKELCGEEDG